MKENKMKKPFLLHIPIDLLEAVKVKANKDNRSITNYIISVIKNDIYK